MGKHEIIVSCDVVEDVQSKKCILPNHSTIYPKIYFLQHLYNTLYCIHCLYPLFTHTKLLYDFLKEKKTTKCMLNVFLITNGGKIYS